MKLGKQSATFLWKHLSPGTKWRLIKTNASILTNAAAKDLLGNRRKKITAGIVAAGVAGGIIGLSRLKNGHH